MKTSANCKTAELCKTPHAGCYDCSVRSISICAAQPLKILNELEALSHPQHIPPKQILFLQGAVVDSVFNVTAGCFRLVRLLEDGRRQIIGFALPGDFLGLASTNEYNVSAESLSYASVCRFNKAAFTDYLSHNVALMAQLLDYTCHELSLAHDQMSLLGRRTAEERIVMFLLKLRERNERLGKQSVTLHLGMSRQDIADHLGLTLETVSRILNQLARERLIIIVPDGVRLLQIPQLEQKISS